ncbi:hypothetical protein [Streptomyces sp. NPDC051561]|uniref:hypothetical protein n=1 Tax=Streptomyces sp. NPDC051561 TaxID=3365658 RepID=UPI003791582F
MPKRDVWVCVASATVNADAIKTIDHSRDSLTVEITVTGRRTPLAVRTNDPAGSARSLLDNIAQCAGEGGHWILSPDTTHPATWTREPLGAGNRRATTRYTNGRPPGAPPVVVPDSWAIPDSMTHLRHASDPAPGNPADGSGA